MRGARFGSHERADDHMYDVAQTGVTPDRSDDELPIRMEVPDVVRQRLA